MFDPAQRLHRMIRDPRLRIVIAVILILLAFALAWHLVGMSDHDSVMLGTCLAVIAMVGSMALAGRAPRILSPASVSIVRSDPAPDRPPPRTGRPPPQQGTVLRP